LVSKHTMFVPSPMSEQPRGYVATINRYETRKLGWKGCVGPDLLKVRLSILRIYLQHITSYHNQIVKRGFVSLRHRVLAGSGAHPASYLMGTMVISLGLKWPGCEVNHAPSSSAEVKNVWRYTSTTPYVSTYQRAEHSHSTVQQPKAAAKSG
jgi:hypothetical protein